MSKVTVLLLGVLAMSYVCDAYKILVAFPMPGKSHGILGEGVARHLLNAGHEVTLITPFVNKKPHKNLTQIDINSNLALLPTQEMTIAAMMEKKDGMADHSMIMSLMNMIDENTLKHDDVQKLLKDPNVHFDLVIVEWMFTENSAGLAAVYDAPLIWVSTVEPHWMILRLIDESLNPSFNGDITGDRSPPFTFLQRVQELWTQIEVTFLKKYKFNDIAQKNYEKILGPIIEQKGRKPPQYEDLIYNASLVLGNSHVSMGVATNLPQSYKPIGGYHIQEEIAPLPKDLQKVMDNSKNGVIYFSMGSNLKSKDMPDEMKRGLLKMFGSLKYTVLWKFEEVMSDLPKNVHILEWAPQQSILAHPNCILFITHGGLLSTTETIHYGVPIIGIPVFADQFINVERSMSKGFALRVDLSFSLPQNLKVAIDEILGNPKYTETVKRLSFIYHDRPVSPGAELVHWAEHVVRTRGAPHLRSPALMVPWYQKLYLDLLAVVLLALIVLSIVIKRLLSVLFGKVRKQKQS